jgi:HK97 family phage prohead protease
MTDTLTSSVERRGVPLTVELRALSDGSMRAGGYAAVFGRESRVIPRGPSGGFVETVLPTFFEESRSAGWPGTQGSGVLARYNHSDMYLLGSTAAGTCQLNVDRVGLDYTVLIPETRADVYELIQRGDVRQSSFTFIDAQDDWSYRGGVTHRTLITGAILDVAPCSSVVGYPDTSCALRSLASAKAADPAEVRALAEHDQLHKLFTRTDRTAHRGDQPMSTYSRSSTLTAHQARLILMAKQHPPTTRAEVLEQQRMVDDVKAGRR